MIKRTDSPIIGSNHLVGMSALAKFLKCSYETAVRLKNSGQISYLKFGKIYQFDPEQILKELTQTKSA